MWKFEVWLVTLKCNTCGFEKEIFSESEQQTTDMLWYPCNRFTMNGCIGKFYKFKERRLKRVDEPC